MKILFLSQIVPYPPHGGVLQRGYNLIREISKYNNIYLLAFVHPDIISTERMITESLQELCKFCEKVEYFPLWPKKSISHHYFGLLLGLFSHLPFSVLAHKSQSFNRRVRELLRTEEINLVHYDTIALTQFDSQEIVVSKVLTHHNIESQLMERRAKVEKNLLAKFYLLLQARRLRYYEKVKGPKYDLNIMMSDVDSNKLRQLAPAVLTSIVPNGVDTQYFCPRNDRETPAVVYTGGMNMFANKDAVLFFLHEIWPIIKAEVPSVIFYAIGRDPPAELKQIGSNDPQVVITGYVNDIRPYVAKSSVYVVPLRVGGGTRLKVLDAMAMGKAIVSTSIGCEGLEIKPDENILIADDPIAFAKKTVCLLQNPEKRADLGKVARNLVESRYSWEIMGKKLQQTYEYALRIKKEASGSET